MPQEHGEQTPPIFIPKKRKKYVCEFCGRDDFNSRQALSYHRLNTCEKRPRDAKPDACDRCGLCCKYVIIPLDRNVRSWKLKFNPEWMATRGIRIIQGNPVLPCTCPELEPPAPGVPATCRCYETRPTVCRILSCKKDLLRLEPDQDLRGPAAAAK